ncbi:zinc-binding dehydrogenase [Corallococcus sp. ZKHCc1 1396]|uniref:alcohol dehydrogenase n=1 Tax=Corallococcus soli TaxID=2710757 RepID=A0ABR9PMH9_9BACT|nr:MULTISPECIES: zinc-binding dehydrogenase [Corallococcus]MBE4749084.1 zinc-binding dehydrogenase [Corallococcus soli]MCY1036108.1 zinc-binding dehydrogenase [Corallococcus sp. BB11-1]
MEAVVLRQFGSAENLRLETVPVPRPGKGEVLLRVHACGVCYHDVINRRGNLPRTHVPAILGHEAAGEVVEVGPDTPGWKVGDRAATLQRMSCGECALCLAGRNSLCKTDNRFFGEELQGGYAQFMVAPVRGLGRVPSSLPWAVAATVCCTLGTAVHTLRTRARVRAGETVLITGASGGVGLAAVQLAKEDGARVIAITSGEAKVAALKEAGADEVIVSRGLDFGSEARRRTSGNGVDVAVEIVGSATFDQTLKSMAPGGRVVVVGNLESGVVNLNPGLVIVKELEILGAYATTREELDESLRLTAAGKIRPFVSEEVALAEAGRAHFRLENREVAGRLVLVPPEA